MALERLLSALADGRTHSGEELARAFGVTRAAVWKQVAKLADFGLAVEAVPGSGYRLQRRLDLLDSRAVRAALEAGVAARVARLEVFTEIDSTNDYLRAAAPLDVKRHAMLPKAALFTMSIASSTVLTCMTLSTGPNTSVWASGLRLSSMSTAVAS